jgi:hypothetical protein
MIAQLFRGTIWHGGGKTSAIEAALGATNFFRNTGKQKYFREFLWHELRRTWDYAAWISNQ